jgi:HlyD family secretion protein
MRAKDEANGQGQLGGQRQGGQGGPQVAGGQRGFGGQQFGEVLKTAGIDDARAEKIMNEMRDEMQKAMGSMGGAPGGAPGGGGTTTVIIGGGGFGPPPSIAQQQASSERFAKMQQTREAVFRRNLNEEEYATVTKLQSEMQSQKRVTVYKLNDKGELERAQLTVGISDGENAQIIRGANEGDAFVVRANAGDKADAKS